MARLKKTTHTEAAPTASRPPFPEHTRTPEYNGIKQGDAVLVKAPGVKPKRGVHYKFSNHVVSPEGVEYLDVIEYRVGYSSGLWRSFPLDAVEAVPTKKRKVAAES